jgi:hypothetical protein
MGGDFARRKLEGKYGENDLAGLSRGRPDKCGCKVG